MAGLNDIKGKVAAIINGAKTFAGDVHQAAIADNERQYGTPRTKIDKEKMIEFPFVKQLRQYARFTEMGNSQLRHVYGQRGNDLLGAVLYHPTKLNRARERLQIGVTGASANNAVHEIHTVTLAVGDINPSERNAYPTPVKSEPLNLPVETPGGIVSVYFVPSVRGVTAPTLVEALTDLAAQIKEQMREKIKASYTSRGKIIDLDKETMEKVLGDLMGMLCLSDTYLNFLGAHIVK